MVIAHILSLASTDINTFYVALVGLHCYRLLILKSSFNPYLLSVELIDLPFVVKSVKKSIKYICTYFCFSSYRSVIVLRLSIPIRVSFLF